MEFEPVIGLEIHAQLLTKSKIFCRCSTKFGGVANAQICPICLGMPGVLPVLNRKAVEFAIALALATECQISRRSIFARKNYFYPDLPKGYQISQYEEPFAEHGHVYLEVDGQQRYVGLKRIHLEEDAGKSMHAESYVAENETLIDVNRCGVPLLEIVTEPEIRSPQEAHIFLTNLRRILVYLEICDGNMDEGSLRCDANVSVRETGSEKLGVKTELKNMNSFKGVAKALEKEIDRQIKTLNDGGQILQETLLWDARTNVVEPMRGKEFAHDYRYFPDPDLVPVEVDKGWIEKVKLTMPELPDQKRDRLQKQYGLSAIDSAILTDTKNLADYYEACAKYASAKQAVCNWILTDVLRIINEQKISITEFPVSPQNLAEVINLVYDGTLSTNIAKSVFVEMVKSGKRARVVIEEKGLRQIDDEGLIEETVTTVLNDHPNEVATFLSGKEGLIGFFVGQVMRQMKGKANPKIVNGIVRTQLNNLKEKQAGRLGQKD